MRDENRIPLKNGTVILNAQGKRIIACNVKAYGGSAIVYEGYEIDLISGKKTYKLIKELYPKLKEFYRDDNERIAYDENNESVKKFYNRMICLEKNEVESYNRISVDEKGIRNDYFFSGSEFIQSDNGNYYIILDTVKGLTLKEIITLTEDGSENVLCYKTLSNVCDYIISLLNTLDYCHQEKIGLLHLDVAPDNIFVSEVSGCNEYRTRLIDFNSSIQFNEQCSEGLSFKFGYSAPELNAAVRNGDTGELSRSTDLYSVAAIMYRMVFKKNYVRNCFSDFDPFFNEISEIKIDGESDLLYNVSKKADRNLRRILEKALDDKPSNRYKNASEFRNDIIELKKQSEETIWLAPTSNIHLPDYCIKRNDFLELIDRALHNSNFIFISGIGGSGKSSIASMYALSKTYGSQYDTVYFAKYYTDLKELVVGLRFHGINEKDYISEDTANSKIDIDTLYTDKLKYLSLEDQRTLLIIDNYNVAFDEYFSEFISFVNCKVIFTTRVYREEDNYIHIGNISAQEAKKFFLDICRERSFAEEQIRRILATTGNHILSLKMIALLLKKYTRVSVEEITEKLEKGLAVDKGKIAIDFNSKTGSIESANGVIEEILARVFSLSDLSAQMSFVLSAMTLIPLSGINKDDFCNALYLDKYGDTVDELIELGWINESDNYISLHHVISDLLYRLESTKPDYDKLGIFLSSDEILSTINTNINDYDTCKRNAVFFTNKIKGKTGECAQLLHQAALCLSDCSEFALEISTLNTALAIAEAVYGNDSPLVGKINANLCSAYLEFEMPEKAIEFGEKALIVFENCFNNDTAKIHNNMGRAYSMLKDYDKAMRHFEKAIAANEKTNTLINTYSNIADLQREREKYNDAEGYYKKALELIEEYNIVSLFTAFVYNNIGALYIDMGEYDEAERYIKQAISIKTDLLPENHIHFANSYLALGLLYEQKNNLEAAKEFTEKALSISVLHNDNFSRKTIDIKNNLFVIFNRSEMFAEAEALIKEVIDYYTNNPSYKNDTLISSYYNAGCLFYCAHNAKKKIKNKNNDSLYRAVASVENSELSVCGNLLMDSIYCFEKVLAAISPEKKSLIKKTKIILAQNYIEIKELEKAKALLYSVLNNGSFLFKTDDNLTAEIKYYLAFCLQSQNNIEEAEDLYFQALDYFLTDAVKNCIKIADICNNLSVIMLQKGKYDAAYKYASYSVKIRDKQIGISDIDIINSHYNLAQSLHNKSDYICAKREYEIVYNYLSVNVGVADEMFFFTCLNLGIINEGFSNQPEALRFYRESYKFAKYAFGEESPYTVQALNRLTDYYNMINSQ